MKTATTLALLIVTIIYFSPASAQRNTLWMRGTSQNSNGWGQARVHLSGMGYDFNNLLFSDTYIPSLGVQGAAGELAGTFEGQDDIMGIAHDYGGLILRDLQLRDESISSLVLVGVPNQGSSIIDFTTITDSGSDGTRAQKLVQAIRDLQSGEHCEDCDMVATFEDWVDGLYGGRTYLRDAGTESSIIAHLNDNIPENVPYAVMWGSIEEFSLSRLLSSRAFPSDVDYYTQCYAEHLERARQKANDAFILSTIRNTTGFLGSVLNFVSAINPGLSPSDWIGRIGSFINLQRQHFINEIQAVQQRDETLASILRCEFANQLLAAEWQLAIMENSLINVEYVPVQVVVDDDYDDCIEACEIDMAWGDWDPDLTCEEDCADLLYTETITVPVYISEENDGLLTRSEQLLSGAAKTYHLEESNHFQETRPDQRPVISDAFQDLFEGGAGPAFIVPR